jgi:hypothetical protein
MVLYIAFLEDAHRSSSRSVACLNDARLEQGIEGSGREGYFLSNLINIYSKWIVG